ncbi:endocuticle structural glycoprotein SgAbd-5-like [Episyrphus balteatus]|uniref:endocuticle structural glycoprotein SgAbd-5-like n=1 Tax=Episyrphus balteatus TaxID=286459 RepID=UPI0024868F2F|nr:endocuticle structural glycoprotein SgAbd-5-like [Episyrphus balteatus]
MKFLIVFAALITVCIAAPAGNDVAATSVRDIRENNGIDKYDFDFETSGGIQRQEHGVLQKFGENSAVVVNGIASWTSPEGIVIVMKFTADENGYHPIV